MVNQDKVECMPAEKLAALEEECKMVDDVNKTMNAEVKTLNQGIQQILSPLSFSYYSLWTQLSELAKLRSTPTDEELVGQIAKTQASVRLF